MKTEQLLEKYKSEILEKLNDHANMYKLIGSSGKYGGVDETPRYYNIAGYDKENNLIKFRSTQTNRLGFDIFIKEEDRKDPHFWTKLKMNNSVIWEWFKKTRTNFLIDEHPTIDAGYEYFTK